MPAMQRIGLDRVDDVARLPAPQRVGDEAIDEAASRRYQQQPPAIDMDEPAQMLLKGDAEQQVVQFGDGEPRKRDAECDDRADQRGDDAEAELAVADVVACP